jgi:hypothetical protein
MRNNDPVFFPGTSVDLSIRAQMNKNYTDCINILQTQWYQGDLDQRFYLGDQDLWGLIFPGVATYRRKIFNFNLINRAVQMTSGYQRRNRKSTVCIPVLSPMQKTADQFTKCLYHIHNKCGAYQVYSDAFEQGALTQGLGFISIYKDTTSDPVSGDIRVRYIDMKATLYDPYFRKHDLSDCRYFWTRQFFDRHEAADLYQEFRDEILALPQGTYRDDKFYYMPEVYQIQFPNLIAFDEYWYLSTRDAQYVIDKETEECQEFEGDEEDLREAIRRVYANNPDMKGRLKVIKKPKPTVRRTIILNDRVLVDEPNPYKIDRYPVVPVLAYFTPDTPYYAYKFRGIVRDMRDAQYIFNRRKVADLDILEAQQQGLKMKKGALVTPDDSLNQGNGRVLVIDPAYQLEDVQQMDIHPPAPGMLQMEEMLKTVMMEISGVNEELLGAAVDDKAGILSMLRQGAGLTTLQRLFDQLDEAQRLVGDIMIEMIQKNWTYGKVKQIIGEEPTPEFDDKLFYKYGCKIIQGSLTETQQQLELQQLLYFKETTGIPIPPKRILEASTIQNKDELIKEIMENEQQQQQMAQQRAMLEMQQLQVDNQTKLSYAKSQEGLANERMAKIDLDKALNAERISRANEERMGGLFNLLKAAKELDGIDIEHLRGKMDILMQLQNITKAMQSPQEDAAEQAQSQPTAQI